MICISSRGIATSFEGKHGSIRYWLKVEMDKPWSFNHKTKKAFTVISPIDINQPEYVVSHPHFPVFKRRPQARTQGQLPNPARDIYTVP